MENESERIRRKNETLDTLRAFGLYGSCHMYVQRAEYMRQHVTEQNRTHLFAVRVVGDWRQDDVASLAFGCVALDGVTVDWLLGGWIQDGRA